MKALIIFVLLSLWVSLPRADSLSGLRDPTAPDPDGAPKVHTPTQKKLDNSLLVLQQILLSQNRKTAVINGKALSIGDKITGATVISISHNSVVLQKGQKKMELQLITHTGSMEANR
ncbi:MAG: MSHA biogenesis protein MshK [Gammaproteobacteria bacterium]|nr:MSHA biogenesis protein MshK [Gammaproteobacteria bacterium]